MEAGRGLIFHRYWIGDDGLLIEARIVPPPSKNQRQIEDDLRDFVLAVLSCDDAATTQRCEQLIRGYDPCICCGKYFLKVGFD